MPLANIASVCPPHVRCLADGRMVVACIEARLPAAVSAKEVSRFHLIAPFAETDAHGRAQRGEGVTFVPGVFSRGWADDVVKGLGKQVTTSAPAR